MRSAASAAVILLGLAGAARAQDGTHGDPTRGETLYADCAACHSLEQGVHAIGPSLYRILGRKAGGYTDYRYSPALKRSGLTWTAEALDTFIADPQASVPANRMPYSGMPDAAARADLIAYLKASAK